MGDFNLRKWREFIISEDINEGEKMVVNIEDITFDMLKDLFPNKYQKIHFIRPQTGEPFYRDNVKLPLGAGVYSEIGDSLALEQWKSKMGKYGEVIIDTSLPFPIQINNPEFTDLERKIKQDITGYYSSKKPGEFTGD